VCCTGSSGLRQQRVTCSILILCSHGDGDQGLCLACRGAKESPALSPSTRPSQSHPSHPPIPILTHSQVFLGGLATGPFLTMQGLQIRGPIVAAAPAPDPAKCTTSTTVLTPFARGGGRVRELDA
jgi:hypothetical protein